MRPGALLLVLVGCGGAPMPAAPDAGGCAVQVTMGTVDEADGGFVALADGAPLTVHAGPQGGYHVFVGVEARGLPRSGLLTWTLSSSGGLTLATRALDVSTVLLEDRPCGWARPRDALVFERNEDVMTFRGVPVTLAMGLADGGVTQRVSVVPR